MSGDGMPPRETQLRALQWSMVGRALLAVSRSGWSWALKVALAGVARHSERVSDPPTTYHQLLADLLSLREGVEYDARLLLPLNPDQLRAVRAWAVNGDHRPSFLDDLPGGAP